MFTVKNKGVCSHSLIWL